MGEYVLNGTPALPQPVSSEPLSDTERERILEEAVAGRVQTGETVVHRQAFSTTLRSDPGKPSHLLHLILTILTLVLWLIPWVIISASSKARHSVIAVDEHGRATLRRLKS
jgi:hypothetical protein